MKEFFQINFHGDSTIVIEFGKDIDVYTNKLVQFVFSKTEKRLYKNLFINQHDIFISKFCSCSQTKFSPPPRPEQFLLVHPIA